KHALESYKAAYGKDMIYQSYGQMEWDVLFIARDAIKAVGYDGTKLAEYFHTSVKDWNGAAGSVTIGSNGDPISGHRLEVIKNGKVEVLK
ncbi:MAG: Receptor family ligand-binding protein, partial [Parcubacteria group bacterium]|nr:Receptor family ligand-binding protein [Parcubacteria group bacterium]